MGGTERHEAWRCRRCNALWYSPEAVVAGRGCCLNCGGDLDLTPAPPPGEAHPFRPAWRCAACETTWYAAETVVAADGRCPGCDGRLHTIAAPPPDEPES